MDMPEVFQRLHIGKTHTLEELEDIFNKICNKIVKGETVPIPALAASHLFPEVFQRARDEYLYF